MKKILNDVYSYVDEMLVGLCAAHPEYYAQTAEGARVIKRSDAPIKGKVGLVTGGGSGHLPVFTGYVGQGLLDAAAIGDVFASPSADQMVEAMRAADGGAGILCIYGNYGGDVMNFSMARDLIEMEDIRTTAVVLADDVASAKAAEAEKRRGVAGLIYAYKVAGAAADAGENLDEVTRLARKAADSVRSIGAALTSCTVPQAGKPTFQIGETEMEMGMGIHGEPGVWRGPMRTADKIAAEMMDTLLADQRLAAGDRASVLINSLGATPPEELYILYRYVKRRLDDLGVKIVMPLVGRYATSMEMAGVSFTFCKLDEELERYLKAPAECAFWKV
ncbi:dihydroxyacetone kinase subunit DhaK [Shumkonia mesophila]|uniref:dihydroxyacetone kinase subunit DhaK n=1 Tax=Shumkonia mesophila TaxID=2838854 RepID=UPI002934AD27|nr:dihydroxyacetone kinase subunit DhaK [Shumkonia mesophila]